MTRSSFGLFSEHKWRATRASALTFDAGAHPAWLNLVERRRQRSWCYEPSSAAAASAAGMLALMRQPRDRTAPAGFALQSLFELATGSVNHGIADPPSEQIAPRSLFRARWLIRQNMRRSRLHSRPAGA